MPRLLQSAAAKFVVAKRRERMAPSSSGAGPSRSVSLLICPNGDKAHPTELDKACVERAAPTSSARFRARRPPKTLSAPRAGAEMDCPNPSSNKSGVFATSPAQGHPGHAAQRERQTADNLIYMAKNARSSAGCIFYRNADPHDSPLASYDWIVGGAVGTLSRHRSIVLVLQLYLTE